MEFNAIPVNGAKNLQWQILPKLIDNICYVLLASAKDQNSSIVWKCEIIPHEEW